jgi:hypothetical protein
MELQDENANQGLVRPGDMGDRGSAPDEGVTHDHSLVVGSEFEHCFA